MMRRFLMASLAVALFFAAQGISSAVTIDGIAFKGCIPEVCQTSISVDATDPAGGNLTYTWEVLNGDSSLLSGSGADVVFDPPDSGPHPCPYRIAVSVTSDASDLSAYQTIEICVKLAGDVNGDCIVNLSDLNEIRDHFMEHGDPGWIDADLNCDGWVNLKDLNLVRDNFMTSSSCTDSYFFDNFECGTGKWTLSGQDWDLMDASTHGGKWSLTDSPDGNYPDYADEIVKVKYSIDLSSATFPVLTFWGKCASSLAYGSDDYIYVDVSDDGGFTWETVWFKHELNQSTWKQEIIDLSPYKSAQFKVRFRLLSDETGTADGWSIDDIEIREFDAVPTQPYPFFDDFESGIGNWIISGQDWALMQDSYVSSTHSLTDSFDGYYPNYSHAVVESAGIIDLSSATFPVLTFWGKCASSLAYGSDDYIYVDVSVDGGLNWDNVWSKHELNQNTWKQEMIDLSPYISTQFKIRFRLASDETGTADGWSIDDVEIREFDAVPTSPYPFFDDFESGVGNWIISSQDWALTEESYRSPIHSITDSPDGNYPNYSNAVLQSAGHMDLSSATFPVLTFWGKCASSLAYGSDDFVYVDVSDDGGLTWDNVWSILEFNQSTWKQEGPIDLRPWMSAHFKIRFRMVSDETGTADGWYLDDIEIAEFE